MKYYLERNFQRICGKSSCEPIFVSRGFCPVSLYFSIFRFLNPCFILVTEIQVNLKFPESFIFIQFISILSRLLKTPSLKFLLLQKEHKITLRLERVIAFSTEVDLGKSEILGTDKEDFKKRICITLQTDIWLGFKQ